MIEGDEDIPLPDMRDIVLLLLLTGVLWVLELIDKVTERTGDK